MACGVAAATLVVAGCGSDGDSQSSVTTPPAPTTDAPDPTATDAPTATVAAESTDAPTTSEVESDDEFTARVVEMGPATGEPMRIGLVNTEGVPGLDSPTSA